MEAPEERKSLLERARKFVYKPSGLAFKSLRRSSVALDNTRASVADSYRGFAQGYTPTGLGTDRAIRDMNALRRRLGTDGHQRSALAGVHEQTAT